MKKLNEEDYKIIEDTIKKGEAMTSGEIVFAVAEASANYNYATLLGAFIGMAITTAVFLMLPINHTTTNLLWTEFISLAVFYGLLSSIPWRRWLVSKKEMDARVREAAFMQFYSSGLYRTRESNGIEIYLSLFERQVVVIGDRGIHEKLGDQQWQLVRDIIIRSIKEGNMRSGICEAIENCAKALAEHFPPRPDDINELPDQVINRSLHPDAP